MELPKDVVCCFEEFMEAALHKIAGERPFTSQII